MCQKNYNIEKEKKKEFKYKHLNYTERTQIERWKNIEHKSCSEIAKLLNKSVRTIQREIKRGLVIVKDQLWRNKVIYDADNRLIRRFIPKGTIITSISEEFIKIVISKSEHLLFGNFL